MTTDEQTGVLVFKNGAGDYFLVTQELLEQGRVPEERKAEVERLLTEAEGDDVSGHWAIVIGVIIGGGLTLGLVNYGLDKDRFPTPNDVPTIEFPPSQEPVRGPDGRPA